jgi:predicted lipid-binding transport protein (Tim44 family)
MVNFAMLSRDVLLLGCLVLSAQMPASAQPAQKPSKPLNLAGFAKPSRATQPRPPAKPEPASANRQPEPPLTTATVAKNATSPLNPGEPAATDQRESDAAQFCKNIADAALDARVAWQQKELEAAEASAAHRRTGDEARRI